MSADPRGGMTGAPVARKPFKLQLAPSTSDSQILSMDPAERSARVATMFDNLDRASWILRQQGANKTASINKFALMNSEMNAFLEEQQRRVAAASQQPAQAFPTRFIQGPSVAGGGAPAQQGPVPGITEAPSQGHGISSATPATPTGPVPGISEAASRPTPPPEIPGTAEGPQAPDGSPRSAAPAEVPGGAEGPASQTANVRGNPESAPAAPKKPGFFSRFGGTVQSVMKSPFRRGLYGAAIGGLLGLGSTLVSGGNLSDVLRNTTTGMALGGFGTAVPALGALGALGYGGYRAMQPAPQYQPQYQPQPQQMPAYNYGQ